MCSVVVADGTGAVEQRAPAEESALPEERAPAAGKWYLYSTLVALHSLLGFVWYRL